MDKERKTSRRYYFVDEAGDGNLFNSRGRVIVGTEGCSRYFILGVLDVPLPDDLARDMENLRFRLLCDPYFENIPSMQPANRKTALAFHANDDLPEVRREVFALLKKYDLRFMAVVKDKQRVIEYVRARNEHDVAYRYHPNELYDYMIRRLFKNLLHKDDEYNIYFSKRGKSDRTKALRKALEAAKHRFNSQMGIKRTSQINVSASRPVVNICLQAADYFLWALQRCYERREDRYLRYIWPLFRMVHDVDDVREKSYGAYYTKRKPLTLAALNKK